MDAEREDQNSKLVNRTGSVLKEVERSPNGAESSKGRKGGAKHKRRTKGVRIIRTRKGGAQSAFPRTTFENALALGEAIQQHAAGQKMRRLTLFEKMDKSPESGPSRMMITNSGKYGVTEGGYQAEFIELTEMGQRATSPDAPRRERIRSRFHLAIQGIPAFNHLYESNKGKRVPSPEVMRDSLSDVGVDDGHRKECVDLFLENAKFLGLLRTSAGAERLIPIEQVLEELPVDGQAASTTSTLAAPVASGEKARKDLKKVCFVIGPIGDEETEERKHSDMVLEALIRRALEGEGLEVVRADKIGNPGMISGQVIEHLLNAGLVIADLSFHNPNVFYELAIRHTVGLPTVHIIRKQDSIPFDLKDFRTIHLDTTDKYELVAKLETYRAEIANHVRIALSSGPEGSNPVRMFAKGLVVQLKGEEVRVGAQPS